MPKDEAQLYAANELYVLLANTSVYIFLFSLLHMGVEVLFHAICNVEVGFYLDWCNMFFFFSVTIEVGFITRNIGCGSSESPMSSH